jgi:hypothetical protein
VEEILNPEEFSMFPRNINLPEPLKRLEKLLALTAKFDAIVENKIVSIFKTLTGTIMNGLLETVCNTAENSSPLVFNEYFVRFEGLDLLFPYAE